MLTGFFCLGFSGILKAQTEMLISGEMESDAEWSVSYLNTPEGSEPAVTWNYTTDTPVSGVGGNLHVTGMSNNSTVQYCIYQPVHMSSDSLYAFDGAFKIVQQQNAWCEVFIGQMPLDGEDYGANSTKISSFGFWAGNSADDGTFAENAADYQSFAPDTTGMYYFVLKMGSTSWDGTDQSFEMMVDELSLARERVAPVVDFSADVTSGFDPLTVEFSDESHYGTSWTWDFGDGSPVSNDQNPVHEYTSPGIY